jgi:predicted amidohydrolase YtcJ
MRYDMVIKGGRVATAEAVFTADIAISGGRIAALGTDLTGAERSTPRASSSPPAVSIPIAISNRCPAWAR